MVGFIAPRRLWTLVPAPARVRVRIWIEAAAAGALWVALSMLEPFVKVRFIFMYCDRIGHLAMNNDVFVRRLQLAGNPTRTKYVFVGAGDVANRALLALWKRHIHVIDSGIGMTLLRFVQPVFSGSRFVVEVPLQSVEYKEFALATAVCRLSTDDEKRGRERLYAMGLTDKDWFVCFHNRDAAYLRSALSAKNFGYHNYRDSNVSNYLGAARLIAERGGFALRLGAIVEDALDESEARIIDYATRFRDEFMDIYLSARCRFFIGTSDGLTQVPLLFDTPIAYANCIPIYTLHYGKASLFIPKQFKARGEDRFLTYAEMQSCGAFRPGAGLVGEWYDERDLEIIENSYDDIRDLCEDMLDMQEGKPKAADAGELQRAYKDRFFGHDPDRTYAPDIGPRFALKYRELITQ